MLDIGSNRELFVDYHLIDKLDGVRLKLGEPRPGGVALRFGAAWEDRFAFYPTVIKDGDIYRLYYRACFATRHLTCYAESEDGINWTRPNLGLVEVDGSKQNNVILPEGRQFTPFLDTRPGVPAEERYKANMRDRVKPSHLLGYVSADGINWRQLRDEPIVPMQWDTSFDSQNAMFWSQAEQCYVLYARHTEGGRRATARATSPDFVNWSEQVRMTYSDANDVVPSNHLYTNQTHPYFRAPQIYISLPGRNLWARRRALAAEDIEFFEREGNGGSGSAMDVSDGVLLSTRAGTTRYDFTFRESFVRPGIGHGNWTARTNYPVLGVVPTSPTEMSLYVNRHYAHDSAWLERMVLRIDGFASVHGDYEGGQMLIKPFVFAGQGLEINYATSAAGAIRVEVQDSAGQPIPGYSLEECPEIIGDQISRIVAWGDIPPQLSTAIDSETLNQSVATGETTVVPWTGRGDLSALAGKPIRLRFVLNDADLYSLRFR
jgi:hypothetical protein